MSYDDAMIEPPKSLIQELPEQKHSDVRSSYGILTLSSKFVEEIHDLVDVAQDSGQGNTPEFKLRHNGLQVTDIWVSL